MASIYLYTAEVSPSDIKLQNVVDDTPAIIISPLSSIPVYNRIVFAPSINQFGTIGIPPTLKLRANTNADIFLYEVLDQLPSTIQFVTSADIFLWDPTFFDAGIINLVIQDILQSQSIDSIILIQLHILTIDDITELQNIENIILIQVHVLIIQDINQGQILENLILTQIHILIIDDITQSQCLDNVILIQTHVLVVQDILQSQNIDEIVITQIFNLLIDNLFQYQSIGNLSISQLHNLIIQDMIQGGGMIESKMKRRSGSEWKSVGTLVTYKNI